MKRSLFLALLLSGLLAGPGDASADEAAWLFEPGHVTQVDLELSDAARAALAAEPREYVSGTFSLTRNDGTTYKPLTVGVKLKGHGSFRTLDGKAAFKLKFNEFVKGQKFQGLKKLTLNNMVQDPTMLHELLAYEAFRAMGLAAPRTGYSFVRVNGEAYGLYLDIETIDSVFLSRWYESTRHLYEAEGGFLLDIVPSAAPRYELDEGDEDDRADLETLIAAVAGWKDIDAVANLAQLTRFWAVERYIGHSDGYSGPFASNYYLHSDGDGRFTMVPWGTDRTWSERPGYGDPGGVMFNQCLADNACAAMYRDAVADVRATVGALDLDGLASVTAALLQPWRQADVRREYTLEGANEGIAALHGFLATRAADAPPWPPTPPPPPAAEPADPGAAPGGETIEPPAPAPPAVEALPAAPPAPAILGVRLEHRLLTARVFVPGSGRLTMRATSRFGGRARVLCRSVRRETRRGTRTARCRIGAAPWRRLRRGRLRVALHVGFVSPGGAAARSVVRHLTLQTGA